MATMPHEIAMVIDVQIKLTLWQAMMLRIAGATFLKEYIRQMLSAQRQG
jgi:hypothetical protein